MPTGLFNKLIYATRKIAFHLKEKQKMTIDDHALEHMLFYHDLAGVNRENNKETRLVKADIKEALNRENSNELSLVLKLAPTLWEEQLNNIIAGLDQGQQQLLGSLLFSSNKSGSHPDKRSFALDHEDWRVRANAANILAFLKVKESVPALIEVLDSDTTSNIMSFCYIAYALGKLQGQEAREALEKQLRNGDAWLRVDAAGALSYFALPEVAGQLADALLREQEALDYMSYAISSKLKPLDFLQREAKEEIRGGCRLILGIIEAAKNSFSKDLALDRETQLCMPYLVKLAQKDADIIVLDTALKLCACLAEPRDKTISENGSRSTSYLLTLSEQEAILTGIAATATFGNKVLEIIDRAAAGAPEDQNAELVAALSLAGKLNMCEAHTALARLLSKFSASLNTNELKNVIIAISRLSANPEDTANLLINLAKKTVKFEERLKLNKHKQPVIDEYEGGAKAYWEILRALGNVVADNSASFLVQALDDYAPDMRACALESIVEICEKDPQMNLPQPIEKLVQIALTDPSAMVQLAALRGVTKLDQANLINDIVPLINVQENTVSKQAISTLAYLAKRGHGLVVKTTLEEKIKVIKEEHKKQRILDLLQNC